MKVLELCEEGALLRREVTMFCQEIGLDYGSEAATNGSFIMEALQAARSYHVVDVTAQGEIVYRHKTANTLASSFPYANILRKYFHQTENLQFRVLMDKQVKTAIREFEGANQHKFLVEVAELDQQLMKGLYQQLNEGKLVYPYQPLERLKSLCEEICQYYNNQYHGVLFSHQLMLKFAQMQPKQHSMELIEAFGLMGVHAGISRYLALLMEHYELPEFIANFHSDYLYKEFTMLKFHPSLVYIAQSMKHFERKMLKNMAQPEELAVYWQCRQGTPRYSLLGEDSEQMNGLAFEDITENMADMVVVSIVSQLGLKSEYEIIGTHLPRIYRFVAIKKVQHSEWSVAVYQDNGNVEVVWKNREGCVVRVYPFLVQLVLFLEGGNDLYEQAQSPQLISSLGGKIPLIQRMVDSMARHRQASAAEYVQGDRPFLEALRQKGIKQAEPVDLTPKQLDSLLFCCEYSDNNTSSAIALLKYAGAQCYQNIAELAVVVDELKMVRQLQSPNGSGQLKSPKKKDKKKGKHESLQLQFKKLVSVQPNSASPILKPREQFSPLGNQSKSAQLTEKRVQQKKGVIEVERIPTNGNIEKWKLQTSGDAVSISSAEVINTPQKLDKSTELEKFLRRTNRSRNSRGIVTPENTNRNQQSQKLTLPPILIQDHADTRNEISNQPEKVSITETTMNLSLPHKAEQSILTGGINASVIKEEVCQEITGNQAASYLKGLLPESEASHFSTINPEAFRQVFRRRKLYPNHSGRVDNPSYSMTGDQSETVNTLVRLLISNLRSPYPSRELADYLLEQTHLVRKLIDFHNQKDWYTQSHQEAALFNLIEEMYRQLRKGYEVDWRNDDLPKKIQECSLPRSTRSFSLKNLRRVKDMPVEQVVDIVLSSKIKLTSKPFFKVPAPTNLFYAK